LPHLETQGYRTWYETIGSGPPVVMLSPGGFNAAAHNWRDFGRYRHLRIVENLSTSYTCVVFDRREAGQSGGRVEHLSWELYASQAKALIDTLGLGRCHLFGGCAGCSVALALAASHPELVDKVVLFSPAGGPRYRIAQQGRFASHLGFVESEGLEAVVALARAGATFSKDPRVGPWARPLSEDPSFAESFARMDRRRYTTIVSGSARSLFPTDTVPGPEAERLMVLDAPALIVPGDDPSHAISAARYLQECLPRPHYWDVAVPDQTEEALAEVVGGFLAS